MLAKPLVLFALLLGIALSVIGSYKKRGILLAGGIGCTTLAILSLGTTGTIFLPYAGLLVPVLVVILGLLSAGWRSLAGRPRVRILGCDVIVLYSSFVGIYAVFTIRTQILLVLLVVFSVLCPSTYYFLRRNRLTYQ